MSGEYYTLVTDIGHAKLTSALALGRAVTLTQFVLGDGNGQVYNPIQSQTGLAREVYRTAINAIRTDAANPSWLTVEAVIPADVGGWTIREAGIVDADGDLIAVAKYPESVKPVLSSGVGKDLYCRLILEHGNVNAVTLKIDPAVVLATKKDLDAAFAGHAADKMHPHPDATTDKRGLVRLATPEDSVAGVAGDLAVTPATLAAAISARTPSATETTQGLVRLANPEESSGNARDLAQTPQGTHDWWQQYAPNHHEMPGWQRLPDGLIMQWGYAVTGNGGSALITFPIAFLSRRFAMSAMYNGWGPLTAAEDNSYASNLVATRLFVFGTGWNVVGPNCWLRYMALGC